MVNKPMITSSSLFWGGCGENKRICYAQMPEDPVEDTELQLVPKLSGKRVVFVCFLFFNIKTEVFWIVYA